MPQFQHLPKNQHGVPKVGRGESWRFGRIEQSGVGLKGDEDPDGTEGQMGGYEVLKKYRLIPSFLIFDSSVCLGMPSFAAAPLGAET